MKGLNTKPEHIGCLQFMYVRLGKERSQKFQSYQELIKLIKHDIIGSYMARCIEVEYSKDDIFNVDENPDEMFHWVEDFKEFRTNNSKMKRIARIVSPNFTAQLKVTTIATDNSVVFALMIGDNVGNVVKIYPLHATIDKDSINLGIIGDSGLYFAGKYHAEKHVIMTDMQMILNEEFPPQAYAVFVFLMSMINSDRKRTDVHYSKLEVKMMKALFNDNRVDKYSTSIKGSYKTTMSDRSFAKFRELNEHIDKVCLPNTNWEKYPYFDLSKKDTRFISQWADKKDIMRDHDSPRLNLMKYFENLKYGDTFIINIYKKIIHDEKLEQEVKTKALVHIIVDAKAEFIRFYVVDKVSDTMSAVLIIDLDNIRDFQMDNLVSYRVDFVFTGNNEFYRSIDEYEEVTGFAGIDSSTAVTITSNLIKLFAVIEERPERHKTITVREKRIYSGSSNNKKKEPEYVVTHIIKNAKDAKEFVTVMSEKAKLEHRDAEYVLESWNRSAHYRHYKSGKVVEIKEQECHRRKPLTTKEVKVKL